VSWKNGKLLVWDATCSDTFAPSYADQASTAGGEVAARAEARKCTKYSAHSVTHTFTPVAIETSEVIGTLSLLFLKELGKRVRQQTGDIRASSSILQRLSVAMQRGNSASILGSL